MTLLYFDAESYDIESRSKFRFHAMGRHLKTTLNSRYFLWLLLALPFIWLVDAYRVGDLFYGEVIHVSGEFSARLLMLTMAITPLRLMFGNARWPAWLLHRRRYFGVASFFYALLHTIVYLQKKASLALIWQESTSFSMWSGWLALCIFLLLAITSNDAAVRRLRRTWKKLHRWVYLAALLGFAHWIFIAFDFVAGLVHFLILLFLEIYRLWKRGKLKRLPVAAGP
jgi:sulfoxide reductase heme-binding subunit YedZ